MNLAPPFAVVALLLAASADSQPAAPQQRSANVCLNVRDIQRTETPDDQTILFHMRDGKIWRNRLKMACPMLKVSPFTEKLTTDLICANQQFIHVALTGNDCALGDFTPLAEQR